MRQTRTTTGGSTARAASAAHRTTRRHPAADRQSQVCLKSDAGCRGQAAGGDRREDWRLRLRGFFRRLGAFCNKQGLAIHSHALAINRGEVNKRAPAYRLRRFRSRGKAAGCIRGFLFRYEEAWMRCAYRARSSGGLGHDCGQCRPAKDASGMPANEFAPAKKNARFFYRAFSSINRTAIRTRRSNRPTLSPAFRNPASMHW